MVFILVSLYLILTIVSILFIFKLTKKYDDKKKQFVRMFSLAFSIPFINAVFYLIAGVLGQYDALIFLVIGAIWLFAILPFLAMTVTAVMIIKNASFKKILFTLLTVFMIYIGYILAIILISPAENLATANKESGILNKEYGYTINYLNSYKNAYGVYPAVLDKEYVHAKQLTDYTYQTLNNQKDFKLSLGEFIYYCSNQELPDCIVKGSYKRVGDWIEIQ